MQASGSVIRLYAGAALGSEDWTFHEQEAYSEKWTTRVVYNVVEPTLTYVPADPALATGAAAIICPGGGFHALSINSEGFDVARWLAAKGVAGFVLKYRMVESKTGQIPEEMDAKSQEQFEAAVKSVIPLAHADGLAAVAHVRQHAAEYGVNPQRIGIMGFSAGGTVTGSVAMTYTPESRPDFAAPIYLAYDWVIRNGVPADAPPLFALAATDDELGLAPESVRIYNDWVAAGKSAELHLYAQGGHGFGMRTKNLPSDRWIELFYAWLGALGFLQK